MSTLTNGITNIFCKPFYSAHRAPSVWCVAVRRHKAQERQFWPGDHISVLWEGIIIRNWTLTLLCLSPNWVNFQHVLRGCFCSSLIEQVLRLLPPVKPAWVELACGLKKENGIKRLVANQCFSNAFFPIRDRLVSRQPQFMLDAANPNGQYLKYFSLKNWEKSS